MKRGTVRGSLEENINTMAYMTGGCEEGVEEVKRGWLEKTLLLLRSDASPCFSLQIYIFVSN